jgi:hypothetical protein
MQTGFYYNQATKRSPMNGGDYNAWNFPISPTVLFSSGPLHIQQPKGLLTRKGCHRDSMCKQWPEWLNKIKEMILKEEEWQFLTDVQGINSWTFCTWPHFSHCLTQPTQVRDNILVSCYKKWASTYTALVPNFYCSSHASGSQNMNSKPYQKPLQ